MVEMTSPMEFEKVPVRMRVGDKRQGRHLEGEVTVATKSAPIIHPQRRRVVGRPFWRWHVSRGTRTGAKRGEQAIFTQHRHPRWVDRMEELEATLRLGADRLLCKGEVREGCGCFPKGGSIACTKRIRGLA